MNENVQQLLELYCSGEITPEQWQLLEQFMEQDDELLKTVSFFQQIGWSLQTEAEAQSKTDLAQRIHETIHNSTSKQKNTLLFDSEDQQRQVEVPLPQAPIQEDAQQLLELYCSGEINAEQWQLLEQFMEKDDELLKTVSFFQQIGWSLQTDADAIHTAEKTYSVRSRVLHTIEVESEMEVAQRVHNTVRTAAPKKKKRKPIPFKQTHRTRSPEVIERTSKNWWAQFSAMAAALLLFAGISFYAWEMHIKDSSIESLQNTFAQSEPNVRAIHVAGRAFRTQAPGAPITLDQHFALDNVQLAPNAELTVQFDDGTVIALRQEAHVKYYGRHGHQFTLLKGRLKADVTPQTSPMTIQTDEARVKVVGTILDVEKANKETRVGVTEGQVELHSIHTHTRHDIRAGEALSINDMGSIRNIPSSDRYEVTIDYNHPVHQLNWPSSKWTVDTEGKSGYDGYITTQERNTYGFKYWIVSPRYEGTNAAFYFAPGQWLTFVYRAHQTGEFTLRLPASRSVQETPSLTIQIDQEDVGLWHTVKMPVSELSEYVPAKHNYQGCRRVLVRSNTIGEVDVALVQISRP